MEIQRSGSQPSGKGPEEYFTGTVRIDPLFHPPAPARAFGASVTFEPGARTAWHTHPLGQTLIVTAGCGRVQRWGGPAEEIRPGDVIWFSPGVEALAWRRTYRRDDPYRHCGGAGRQECRLDGTGQRRTIQGLNKGLEGKQQEHKLCTQRRLTPLRVQHRRWHRPRFPVAIQRMTTCKSTSCFAAYATRRSIRSPTSGASSCPLYTRLSLAMRSSGASRKSARR